MKSVIVFYVPDDIPIENAKEINEMTRKDFEIFIVFDPNIKKIKTKVFFKPE